jgi:hypothetical protein
VHAERAEHLSTSRDEVSELLRLLGHLRLRLGLERLLVFAVRGSLASAVALSAISVAAWLMAATLWEDLPYLVASPFLAAIGLALVRWPTDRQAALAADRRLSLDERLGTAVELAPRLRRQAQHSGRFDRLQVEDAVEAATAARGGWLAIDRTTRREALLALVLLVLAAASLVLPGLPRPSLPAADPTPFLDLEPSTGTLDRPSPAETQDLALAEASPIQQRQVDADLATRVQLQQAERDALDKLSQALGQVSAGQPAADAIQRGDFASARSQLSTLGDETDQLSDAAKQQLSRALQQASSATAATDRQLADRERQAAQALSRSSYAEQRQALANLGDQVQRSGARSVPADQLARDVGRLQQAAAAGQQGQGAQGQAAGNGQPQSAASATAAQAAGPDGQGTQGAAGQQGGPGMGTGTDGEALGNQSSRLDTAGQSVQVPTMLGAGPGARPTDGTEDQTGNDPTAGTRTVSELVQAQQTGQVAPEQNLVPGEQRPVVRGYFR